MDQQMELPLGAEQGGTTQPGLVEYDVMVRNLFKRTDYHHKLCGGQDGASLMHAAIGVCGEVYELRMATSIEDVAEELGDISFYAGAMGQVLEDSGLKEIEFITSNAISYGNATPPDIAGALDDMLSVGHTLLNTAKRVWVYGEDMADHADDINRELGCMFGAMSAYAARFGLSMDRVLILNQLKLAKRYPSGVYTNADASKRADKDD